MRCGLAGNSPAPPTVARILERSWYFIRSVTKVTQMNTAAAPSTRTHSSHRKILLGLAIGAICGLIIHVLKIVFDAAAFKVLTETAKLIGSIFLRMMQMAVLPLVISSLYIAIVNMGDLRRLGRIGATTLGFTAILSISSVLIGFGLVNIVRPGEYLPEKQRLALIRVHGTPGADEEGEQSTAARDQEKATRQSGGAEKTSDKNNKSTAKSVAPSGSGNGKNPAAKTPTQNQSENSENKDEKNEAAGKDATDDKVEKTFVDSVVDFLPLNPFREVVEAVGPQYAYKNPEDLPGRGILAVMVFALICGAAASIRPAETATVTSFFTGIYEISMVIIEWALKLAPVGAGCLVFGLIADLGFDAVPMLAMFVFVVIGGLLIQLLVVYPIVLIKFCRLSPLIFFSKIREAMLLAFSTSSSSATLSTSMKVAQEDLKLTPQTSTFVLTVGATGNQNGTALFEGVAVLFLAQVFGRDLTLLEQLPVVFLAVIAGIGTAGVPGGSMGLLSTVLATVGVPSTGVVVILGVDRLLDMCRTVVNVVGDLVVATCVDAANREV